MDKILCIGYICFMTGLAAGQVGEMPKSNEPYPLWLPLSLFLTLAIPSWLAYKAGRKDAE